ncbi:MAG: RHS repeat-associated core domain-containing protein [Acidobacteria bacterium]|nr:RHS repeat-associated core domain-containing protein [Acidobacteriota bacterium]
MYRLLGETIAGDPAAANNGSLGYTLDAAGNRLSLASTLAALGSQAHSYDANDRMSGDSFDANGNTLASGGTSYSYDFEDRLASAGGAVLLAYDGDGHRVARAEGGVTIRLLVDDLSPTGFPQVVEEVMAGQVIRQYSYGLKPVSQRRWIAGANWQVDFYGYDATGSVRQLTDAAGAVTDAYAYDAFGNVVARTGSTPNALLYRAEWYDASLAMYYLRARWYRPQVGRFVTADTYEGEEDQPGSLHRYLYAGADPVNRIDPSGFANTIENAQATQISGVTTQTALRPVNTRIASRTLGQVRRGADIANDVACCLDKTWSVLDLAVQAAGGVHNPALDLIDEACQLGCPTRGETAATRGAGQLTRSIETSFHRDIGLSTQIPVSPVFAWMLSISSPRSSGS